MYKRSNDQNVRARRKTAMRGFKSVMVSREMTPRLSSVFNKKVDPVSSLMDKYDGAILNVSDEMASLRTNGYSKSKAVKYLENVCGAPVINEIFHTTSMVWGPGDYLESTEPTDLLDEFTQDERIVWIQGSVRLDGTERTVTLNPEETVSKLFVDLEVEGYGKLVSKATWYANAWRKGSPAQLLVAARANRLHKRVFWTKQVNESKSSSHKAFMALEKMRKDGKIDFNPLVQYVYDSEYMRTYKDLKRDVISWLTNGSISVQHEGQIEGVDYVLDKDRGTLTRDAKVFHATGNTVPVFCDGSVPVLFMRKKLPKGDEVVRLPGEYEGVVMERGNNGFIEYEKRVKASREVIDNAGRKWAFVKKTHILGLREVLVEMKDGSEGGRTEYVISKTEKDMRSLFWRAPSINLRLATSSVSSYHIPPPLAVQFSRVSSHGLIWCGNKPQLIAQPSLGKLLRSFNLQVPERPKSRPTDYYNFDPFIDLIEYNGSTMEGEYDYAFSKNGGGGWEICGLDQVNVQKYVIHDQAYCMGLGSVIVAWHSTYGVGSSISHRILRAEQARAHECKDASGHIMHLCLANELHFDWAVYELCFNYLHKRSVYVAPFVEQQRGRYHDIAEYKAGLATLEQIYPPHRGKSIKPRIEYLKKILEEMETV